MQISQLAKIMKFAKNLKCENFQYSYTHYSGIQLYTNIAFRRPYDKYLEGASFLETEGSYIIYFNYILACIFQTPKLNASNTAVYLSVYVPHTLKHPCIGCLSCVSYVYQSSDRMLMAKKST